VGTWLLATTLSTCGNSDCARLVAEWEVQRKQGLSWMARQSRECQLCQSERLRRCRVIFPGQINERAHEREPFANAPYIHPWNAPKYHAQQLRAVTYAKAAQQRVHWIVARDWIIEAKDEKLTLDRIEALRSQFLQLHDKKTAGIMGLFPAVLNMPVRLTQTEESFACM